MYFFFPCFYTLLDTYLVLANPVGTPLVYDDDFCPPCSRVSYTVPSGTNCGSYQIREGCYASNACSGTVSYTVSGTFSPTPAPNNARGKFTLSYLRHFFDDYRIIE